MRRSRWSFIRLPALAVVLSLGLAGPGCGGGDGGGVDLVLTGITMFNSTITSTGAPNTQTITRIDALGSGGQTLTYFPVNAPGTGQFIPLGPGNWFVTVTYTDGTHETGQVAADPIVLTPGEDERVAFLY